MPNPNYFIVACHGWSASHWLASSLNMHPDIICCHSALNVLATKSTWEDNNLQNTVNERENARRRRGKVSIDTLLTEVESYGTAKAYGNVHTIRVRDLVDLDTSDSTKKPCIFANIVRHPISVVASGSGQFEDMITWDIHALIESSDAVREIIDIAKPISEEFGLNLCDAPVRSFIAASQHLTHLARDQRIAPDIKTIKMEHVTSDKDYLREAVNYLTNDNLDITEEYINSVFSIGKLNSHKKEHFPTVKALYESWEPWKKHLFCEVAKKHNIIELYDRHDYDFSFVTECGSI